MIDYEVPIRELHARTGHYVRGPSTRGRIVVTDGGVPVAELRGLAADERTGKETTWAERPLVSGFAALEDDRHLLEAASHFGLKGRNVISIP